MKSMTGVPPVLELIEPNFHQSFTFRHFEGAKPNHKPFWHFHPEIELVFIKSGSAKRHIGNHISKYSNGDLILLGPNLPHFGFTDRLSGYESEIVVQMKPDFLGPHFFELPEMKEILALFQRATIGIAFNGMTKTDIGIALEKLSEKSSFEKLLGILKILKKLALSNEYELLNTSGPALVYKKQDNNKIELVYEYIKENFKEQITLETISEVVSMEVPSFCRYFKRVTGKTFTEFVNEFRVNHACKLISETDLLISAICFDSGFNNSSHFNRLFKAYTGKTPLEYRDEVVQVLV